MRRVLLGTVVIGLLVGGPALQAKAPKEQFCSLIRETPDGKFKVDMQMGWSLYRAQKEDGQIEYDADVKGVTCLRNPPYLTPEDAETLKQGISLYFSDPKSGTTIQYKAVNGVITHNASEQNFSKSKMRKFAKALAEAQVQM